MRYRVEVASIPNFEGFETLFIPGTEAVMSMGTDSGIWQGYLIMAKEQSERPLPRNEKYPERIVLTEKDPEIDRFRECLNLFFRLTAGGGRDNCMAVKSIQPAGGQMTITPTGPFARKDGERPLTATLHRSQGSWRLTWEDGNKTDLQKSSSPPENHGYSLDEIVKMVTA